MKSPSNTFADFAVGGLTHLRVAVSENIFFASKNPIEKKLTSNTRENCSYFHRKFESRLCEQIETSSEP